MVKKGVEIMERREAQAVVRELLRMPSTEVEALIARRRRGVSHDVVWLEGDEAQEVERRAMDGKKTDASN